MTNCGRFFRCDTVPEQLLGRQFGIVSMGLTIGSLVGPPVAGTLYKHWGFRAPFIFGIIITCIDLLSRLLLIERHEALRWGIDPMIIAVSGKEKDPEIASGVTAVEIVERPSVLEPQPTVQGLPRDSTISGGEGGANVEIEGTAMEGDQAEKRSRKSRSHITLLPHIVLLKLMRSSRAGVCIILTIIWGFAWAAQESTVVLHLNRVWGLDPHGAGTAFIAAIIPTIFCESRVLKPCDVP